MIDAIRPLFSSETVNVLQLVGFNFRTAIGEPLTQLVGSLILSRAAPTGAARDKLEELKMRREVAYAEVAGDPEAFARLQKIYGSQA